MALMARTAAEGAQGTFLWKGAPVNTLACFLGSLPCSRIDWQVRRDCGPRGMGRRGS